jgi:acetylornithine/N-succinyldiaminopimelate aminotransferase
MAAVLATLETIEDESMIENARAIEARLRAALSGVAAIRGKGCLIGLELPGPCGPVHSFLIERRILTGTSSDPKVLRLLPPLCTSEDQVDLFVMTLKECVDAN